jgi:hypothetical protein
MKSHFPKLTNKTANLSMQFELKNDFQNIFWSWPKPYKPRINNMVYQHIN